MDTYSPVHYSVPLEGHIDSAISNLGSWCQRAGAQYDAAVREQPRKATALAVAVGAIGQHLPIHSLLGSVCKLMWAIAPPALAVVGAIKVAQHLRRLDDEFQDPLRNAPPGPDREGDAAREPERLIVLPDAVAPPATPAGSTMVQQVS